MDEPIVFLTSIPLIQTAIKVAGDGGARIQLDIPESEREAIKAIMDLRGGVLIATLQRQTEEVKESQGNGGPEAKRRAALSPTEVARRRV